MDECGAESRASMPGASGIPRFTGCWNWRFRDRRLSSAIRSPAAPQGGSSHLTFAPRALYAFHLSITAAWGLAPLEDQQLAGLIMLGRLLSRPAAGREEGT